ncbi:MAG TPA: class I SAM-dependent methyltransferase [Bacteroidetes bacterium]|nr:class I SAM-dependent methyltransferase [Bacteroidota bacterium]
MLKQIKDFNNPDFAIRYIRKHKNILTKLGYAYAGRLTARGFKKGKILDSGCGSGDMVLAMAENVPGYEITGVDLSKPLLEYARAEAEKRHLTNRVKFLKADVHTLPFDDNSFDAAFSINMVHWVNDPASMLQEIERVLKPEGYLFIKDLRRSWLGILENEIRSALTTEEAGKITEAANLRKGTLSKSLLWWNYEV